MIRIKRAYEPVEAGDGARLLVDRLWPRGLTKEKLKLRSWQRELAPSGALRKWFGHDPGKWAGFQERYRKELSARGDALEPILALARKGTVTLVFGAKDVEHNHALVLKEFLEARIRPRGGSKG